MKKINKLLLLLLTVGILLFTAGCQKQAQEIDYQSMIDSFVFSESNTHELTVGEEHTPSAASWLESGAGTVYTDREDVVSVTQYGTVTAVSEGHAYVVITADRHGSQYEVFRYDVYAPVPIADLSNLPDLISGINLSQMIEDFDATSENSFELNKGEQHTPVVSAVSENQICYSTDETVITVSENGTVTAVEEGMAYVVYESGSNNDVQVYQYFVK